MRNLKKILSLALALVMVMSLLTVASAKTFNDADQIEHTEAVEVMSALGVINGQGNNTFNPTGNVTRAEMAKMITLISLGNVEPDAFKGTKTNLTDIDGHWAEAYIKYCYSQGIIAGMGNGTFAPNAYVKSVEAAKMLLVAIGYDSDVQIYTGSQWQINVIRDAQISKFFDKVTVPAEKLLTRDEAAQMMYNALINNSVEKIATRSVTTGEVTWEYRPEGDPLLEKSFDAKIYIGTLEGNSDSLNLPRKDSIQVKKSASDTATFPYDTDLTHIGEEVKVIFKDGTGGVADKPDRYDTIYGMYVTGSTEAVWTTRGDVKKLEEAGTKIKVGNVKYDVNTNTDPLEGPVSMKVVVNYVTSAAAAHANTTQGVGTEVYNATAVTGNTGSGNSSALTKALMDDTGDPVKLVLNDSGKVYAAYITTSQIAAVTAVTSEKVSMNNSIGTIEFDGNDIYSGIAKGDVVTVTTLYDSDIDSDTAYNIVRPAEVVSGTVNGYKGSPNESITLNGTTYKVYDKANMLPAVSGKTVKTAMTDTEVGDEFDLYLVNGYVGAAVVTAENADNYAMVINITALANAGDTFDALRLQILCGDGTKKIITVSDKSQAGTLTSGDYALGDIITYTGSDNDAKVTIKKAWTGNFADKAYNDTTKTIDGLIVAENCVLFAQTDAGTRKMGATAPIAGTKFETFTLRSLKNFHNDLIYVTNDAGTRIVAVAAYLGNRPSGSAGSTVYGMITKLVGFTGVGENNDVYKEYIVTSGGQDYTLYMPIGCGLAEKEFVYFDPTVDNIYTTSEVTKLDPDAPPANTLITGVYASELVVDGNDRSFSFFTATEPDVGGTFKGKGLPTTWALAKDCPIVYVDVDGKKAGTDTGDVPEFNTISNFTNAIVVYDTANDEIIAIIVNTDNKADVMAVSDDAMVESIEQELAVKGGYTTSGNFNFSDTPVTVPDGSTLTVNGAVTGTVAQVSRPVAADPDEAIDAPAPAVTFKGGSSVTGFSSNITIPVGAQSTSLAIYTIDLSDVSGIKAASKVKDGTGAWTSLDDTTNFLYNLIVGNKTTGAVTLVVDINGNTAADPTNNAADDVSVTINFPGWN